MSDPAKPKFRKPKPDDLSDQLQHAVVRGDETLCAELRRKIELREKVSKYIDDVLRLAEFVRNTK